MAKPEPDIHKIDYFLTHEAADVPIGVQLKATGQDVVREDFVEYVLDKKTYNKLRKKDKYWRFLILLPLPLTGNWVTVENDCVTIRRAMYWCDFRGAPPLEPKAQSISLRIPRTQLVTPEWLVSVFKAYVEGDE